MIAKRGNYGAFLQQKWDLVHDLGILLLLYEHLSDSQARCSRGLRPSLAESVLSSTYWGREDDLDIEYSLFFQQNANLMLAHCL